MPLGPTEAARSVVVCGLQLCLDDRGILLHLVHHRCVLTKHLGLEGLHVQDDPVGALGLGAGAVYEASHERGVHYRRPAPALRSGQYVSLAFTEALIDAGIAGSIRKVGDALMEFTIGLFNTEVIDHERDVWSSWRQVEQATASWVR